MATWVSTKLMGGKHCEEDLRAGNGQETHQYIVTMSDDTASATDALYSRTGTTGYTQGAITDYSLPTVGTRLGTSNAYVSKRNCKQDPTNARIFIADITYETYAAGQAQPKPDDATDSTKWNVEVSGRSSTSRRNAA